MHARRTWRRSVPCSALSLCLAATVADAQPPPLAPTVDTTIVVTGVQHYSSIRVPAGVTVRFVGGGRSPLVSPPAVVLCDGDAIVHGTLSVAAIAGSRSSNPPAGWVRTGRGSNGWGCWSQLFPLYSYFYPPTGGRHAGAYGSAMPFSLEGGSPGGGFTRYIDLLGWPCAQIDPRSTHSGGGAGGTLVLLAGGRIVVGGTVTADGQYEGSGSGYRANGSGGSGGSILLRGEASVNVMSGGTITARGGTVPQPWYPTSLGGPGYVRLDAWGSMPIVQGSVMPETVAFELPYLNQASTPRIGRTWLLDVHAPWNTPVFVSASLQAGPGRATRYGVLGIDPATSRGLGYAVTQSWSADAGQDPRAEIRLPVPDMPALIGLPLWVQAFAIPPTLPPRLTNTLSVVVQ